jgi:hypothetical protein
MVGWALGAALPGYKITGKRYVLGLRDAINFPLSSNKGLQQGNSTLELIAFSP